MYKGKSDKMLFLHAGMVTCVQMEDDKEELEYLFEDIEVRPSIPPVNSVATKLVLFYFISTIE